MPEETEVVAPRMSTYSQMQAVEETPTAEVEAPVEADVVQMPVIDEPAATTTETAVETTEAPTTEAPAENDVANTSFEIPSFDAPAPAATVDAPTPAVTPAIEIDWREAIKKADKKELLKELGIEDFAIELNDHIKSGGQAADYLNAKARDWTTVSDLDVIRDEYKAKYPNLTPEEIERKITRKYAIEDVDEDAQADGAIDLKSDAYELRQQRIERDKKLVIPSTKTPEADVETITKMVFDNQEKQRQENYTALADYIGKHEATTALMQSKRVALDLGANGKFNFTVDKPEVVTRAIYDPSIWNKLTHNEKGEPNVALLQELVLYAVNPAKYKNDLVNYGKSMGAQNMIAEGQNAKRPLGTAPKPDDKPTYSKGTYGGMG
jgi:hypothetical protein